MSMLTSYPPSTMSKAGPSSNWQSLKKKLPADQKKDKPEKRKATKHEIKRKHSNGGVARFWTSDPTPQATCSADPTHALPEPTSPRAVTPQTSDEVTLLPLPVEKQSRQLDELRQMVAGNLVLNESKRAPGMYLAIDCEMVGLGHMGSESALARVSLVNFHGHVVLDTFVQPREKVTDFRTWVSGVKAADVANAPEFDDVQKQVAKLVEGRILIGHAIENDTKALLLSHPAPFVRDTQKCKQLREAAKTKRPGLKKLAEIELGIKIQEGKHSSITDARATMALYRLHKGPWEASLRKVMDAYRAKTAVSGKRKRVEEEGDEEEETEGKRGKRPTKGFPGGGQKGISSGLSVVVKRFGKKVDDQPKRRGPAPAASSGGNWWEEAA